MSATPATQNDGGCEFVPRLPRKNEGGCEVVPRLARKMCVLCAQASPTLCVCVWESIVR